MKTEEAKKIIEIALKNMGCEDITFRESKDDFIVVAFNFKEITSFVAEVKGWISSGIQLDPTGEYQYKIDFKKL